MVDFHSIADCISPLIGKLASPHDGEVLSAARAIGRRLDKHGLTFNDMAIALKAGPVAHIVYRDRGPKSKWLESAGWCADHPAYLSDKEACFITYIRGHPYITLTEKQARWLQDISDRIKIGTTA